MLKTHHDKNKQGGFLDIKLIILFVVVVGLGVLLAWRYVDSKAKLAGTNESSNLSALAIGVDDTKILPAEESTRDTSATKTIGKKMNAIVNTEMAWKYAGYNSNNHPVTIENPEGSNQGPKIDKYMFYAAWNQKGKSWHTAFVSWVHYKASGSKALQAYTAKQMYDQAVKTGGQMTPKLIDSKTKPPTGSILFDKDLKKVSIIKYVKYVKESDKINKIGAYTCMGDVKYKFGRNVGTHSAIICPIVKSTSKWMYYIPMDYTK